MIKEGLQHYFKFVNIGVGHIVVAFVHPLNWVHVQ